MENIPNQTPQTPFTTPPYFPSTFPKNKPKSSLIKFIIGIIVVLIIGTGVSLATRIWDPLWNPFRIEHKEVIEEEITEEEIEKLGSYFVLRESPPSLGGGEELWDILYIGADGFVQVSSQETGEGVILKLAEGRYDTTAFFQALPADLPSAVPLLPTTDPSIIIEGRGALIRLDYRGLDGKEEKWSGPPDKIPVLITEIIQQARDIQANSQLSPAPAGNYIRASRVLSWIVEDWRRTGVFADIVTAVTEEHFKNSPFLQDALEYEERLVPLSKDENLYTAIGKAVDPWGRAVKISVGEDVFQVSNLVLY